MSHTAHKYDINITPLIDIVLVLLIVFIVLVPSLAKVSIAALPTLAPPPPPGTTITPLVLSLDAEGQPFLQQEAIAWSEIRERLVSPLMLQPHGSRKVFLKVAGDLPHGTAVRAMDEIRVASNLARQRTNSNTEDGGEAKIVLSLNKL